MIVPNLLFGNFKKCLFTNIFWVTLYYTLYIHPGSMSCANIPQHKHLHFCTDQALFKVIAMKPSNIISLIMYFSAKTTRSSLRSNLGAGYSN